jgi:lipoate-protein ligase A
MSATEALEWEKQALREVLIDQTSRFLIWEPLENVMVLPASSKWKTTPQLTNHMAKFGWQIEHRKTGGSPVPQAPGVLNLSMVYSWPSGLELSTSKSYQLLITILELWLSNYGVIAETGEVTGAYCNGAYNLSINNKKFIGTAQRISRGSKVNSKINVGVLAHAFILISPNITNLVDSVNQCYRQTGHSEVFSRDAMTSLTEYDGDINVNYNKLANDLYQSAKYVIDKHRTVI